MYVSSIRQTLYIPFCLQSEGCKSFYFSSNKQGAIKLGIEQRLDTIAISSGEECLCSRVVETESEFTAQVLDK